MAQAALGSSLEKREHRVDINPPPKPVKMDDEKRKIIAIAMSESESTHDRYN